MTFPKLDAPERNSVVAFDMIIIEVNSPKNKHGLSVVQ